MGLAVAVGAPLLARGRGWSNDSSLKRENKKKEREREREPVHVFQMWRTDSYSWWAATVNGFGVVH